MSVRARPRRFPVAALWFLAAAQAFADPPAAGPVIDADAFRFTVKEPRIVLGETASVEVAIAAVSKDGAPLDTAPPRLSSSTGTLSAPVRTGPGAWTVTFTPPKEAFPHVALLFAAIDTRAATAVGFTSLHLWGKGETTVKTKPKSQVTVFIGNESFGPVAADDDGAARVPIVVPPGPERAVARSVDDVGNESQKTIDLGVPTFNRLAMVALDGAVPAGGEARLLVLAVDKKGEPLYEAKLQSKATVGDVDKDPVGLSPGMFKLGYRPGNAKHGKATVETALEGAPGSTASADVDVLVGRPARASLDSATSTLTADDPREVTVVVRLFDGGGNAEPALAAAVDVDFGRIDSISDAGGGARKVVWVLPPQLRSGPEGASASMTVHTAAGEVLGKKDVALLAGKPAVLAFDPVDSVVGDGNSSVDVHLRVKDAVGNAITPTGASIAVDTEAGQLVGATVDGKLYRARFVPAARDRADLVALTGTFGALSTSTNVKVVPRPRARLLVGPAVTVGTNYGGFLQAGPDISLLVRLPGFDGSVHAGLSVSLLQGLSHPTVLDSFSVDDHRAYPLYLEGAWRPLVTTDLALHLGAAAGFVLVDETVFNEGQGFTRLPRTVRSVLPGLAAQAVVGAGYRVGPGFLELDVRAGYATTFPADIRVGAPLGAGVVLGYRFGI